MATEEVFLLLSFSPAVQEPSRLKLQPESKSSFQNFLSNPQEQVLPVKMGENHTSAHRDAHKNKVQY